jgi:hypothetical protein
MVGFRVFDVGLLLAWLFWFFRMRDDGADPPEEEGGGGGGGSDSGGPGPRRGPDGGGLRLPLGAWKAGRWRLRDGHRSLPTAVRPLRPLQQPLPARVRFPGPVGPARVSPRR